jgi:hypothetical protein
MSPSTVVVVVASVLGVAVGLALGGRSWRGLRSLIVFLSMLATLTFGLLIARGEISFRQIGNSVRDVADEVRKQFTDPALDSRSPDVSETETEAKNVENDGVENADQG